jgi:hypothetical protein
MAEIEVTRADEAAGQLTLQVSVAEGGSRTQHLVTVKRQDLDRLAGPDERAEDLVRRCFEFLLEREPKESILSRFDLSVIGDYFPEFEEVIRRSLG